MFPDRKAFNFFKSYWEVAKELDNKNRLEFYDALMRRQFTGVDSELSGMAKFAWISQRHSIDSQVNGLLYKSGVKPPTEPPPLPPTVGATEPPPPQVKGKGEEKEEVINFDGLLIQFNLITGRKFKVVCDKTKKQFNARLKDGYSKNDILKAIKNCYSDPYHIETNHKYLTLEFISRPDKMEKYATDIVKPKTERKKEIGML